MFYLLYQKNLSIHYIMLSTEYQLSCAIVLLYHIIGYSSANCPVLYILTGSMLKLKKKKGGNSIEKETTKKCDGIHITKYSLSSLPFRNERP